MKATFLAAAVPLTKTFTLENGQLKKSGHPRIIDVSSFEHEFEDIETLYSCIQAHAEEGHSFLKGGVSRQLTNESRAGASDLNAPTQVLLLDLDGIKGVSNTQQLLDQLRLGDVDHIVQYSSSMGVIPERGQSAHVFMLIDKPWYPGMLKQWLMHMNLTNFILRQNLGLASTCNALRWALDVSTCQNDKLIYIAPPILGPGVVDHFEGDRIQLIKGAKRYAELGALGPIPSAEANRIASEAALNDLREKAGLPRRKRLSFTSSGPIEYMARPDQAVVTGVKKERGFVYLNLNNGDSWGYYHAESNPEFIHNFKGEPVYKTSELLPEYWAEARKEINTPRFDQSGTIFLAFRDFRTAAYWNGTWNKGTNALDLHQARGSEQIRDFLKQHGQPVGDFIPDWNVIFNPSSTVSIDTVAKTVNTFQPTRYMLLKPGITEVPPLIRRIFFHALGSDDEAYEHFLNWLAVAFRYRTMTGTAQVLHGVQGTGKGLMRNRVLAPLFGYVEAKRTREFDSQFNGWLEKTLILWIDEAEIALQPGHSLIESDLKNYITEPVVSIRKMHMLPYLTDNYMSLILASNKGQIITIDPSDRRFNVAPFQPRGLVISKEEVARISDELEAFASYLLTRTADTEIARIPLNNPAKQKLIHIGMASIDVVCNAILTGDFAFLWDQRPLEHLKEGSGNVEGDILGGKYIRLMKEIALDRRKVLIREEVQTILAWTIGGISPSPYKFASTIKHHGIILESTSRDGKSVRGIKVDWKISGELIQEAAAA